MPVRIGSSVPFANCRRGMLRVCETILNDVRGFISLIPRKTARKNGRSVTIPIFRSAGIETATTGQDGPRKRALVSFHSLRHALRGDAAFSLFVRTCLFGDVVFGGICKRHKAK